MNGFFYGLILQWKMDLRNKDIIIVYYILPLVFFAFMGNIFSLDPDMKKTLIPAMSIFAVSAGAYLGTPVPLASFYGTEMKKGYKAGHIPLWTPMVNNMISALLHLTTVSMVIYGIAPLLFQAERPGKFFPYLGMLLLFMLATIAIGTFLGLFIKGTSKMTLASQCFFLPSIMFSGIMLPASLLPSFLEKISYLLPATWAFRGMTGNELQKPAICLAAIIFCIMAICMIKLKKECR